MAFIVPGVYEQIRAAMGTFVDSDMLPDETIALDVYAGRTDDWVKDNDAAWATRSGGERSLLIRAAILYCAGLLASAMPAITMERFGDYQYSAQVDWDRRASDLISAAGQVVASVVGSRTGYAMPTLFATAAGTRGR